MKYGIQRRGIYLEPLRSMELLWLSRQFTLPEISNAFSLYGELPEWHFRNVHRQGRIVVGIIRRVQDRERIGFVAMFAPDAVREYWEIAGAISEKQDRDAFSMLHAVDAISHYMFDHLKIPLSGARILLHNASSEAVVRRLGHTKVREEEFGGDEYSVYILDRDAWARRLAKLEKGEVSHPSGTGGVFVTLKAPYIPVQPAPKTDAKTDE